MSDSPSEKPSPDWRQIEQDYRVGIKSVRQIAGEHGVSHTAIQKAAKRHEWSRDLSAKITARADELVAKSAVASPVATESGSAAPTGMRNLLRPTEAAIVDGNARVVADVRLTHRRTILRLQSLATVLTGELEVTSSPEGQGLVESLMDAVDKPDEDDEETALEQKARRKKQLELLDKVLGLPERIDSMKRLVELSDRLVQLERQAHGITDKTPLESAGGPMLNDAERSSRAATLLQMAMARKLAGEPPTDATAKAPRAA